MRQENKPKLEHIDLLCVGASLSSLYFAHKLCEDKSDLNMIIVDSKTRIGGSLDSVPLSDEKAVYAAEGGEVKLFQNQVLVNELLKKFCLTSSPLINQQLVTDTKTDYLHDDNLQIADPSQISNVTMFVKKFGWNSLKRYGDSVGYMSYVNNMNLDLFLARNRTYGPHAYIQGGVRTLLERMAKKVKCKYPIHLNTPITNIRYAEKCGRYIINDRWAATSVMFTGTPDELFHINTLSDHIQTSKRLLVDAVANTHNLMRVYIEFVEPWWTSSQIGYTFRSFNVGIGTMVYYSSNTIMIVADERKADTMAGFLNFANLHLAKGEMSWQKPFRFSKLVEYLKVNIRKVVNEAIKAGIMPYLEDPGNRLNAIQRVAVKYTEDAFLNFGTMSRQEYMAFFDTLHSNNGFHIISGDYVPNMHGFIDSSLECVRENYLKIILGIKTKQSIGYPSNCYESDPEDYCNDEEIYDCGC